MDIDKNMPKINIRLSKSKRAVLIFDKQGYAFITSVAWMKMLIEDRADNSMIQATQMSDVPTTHFLASSNKIQDFEGDPMTYAAQAQSNHNKPKVKGDW